MKYGDKRKEVERLGDSEMRTYGSLFGRDNWKELFVFRFQKPRKWSKVVKIEVLRIFRESLWVHESWKWRVVDYYLWLLEEKGWKWKILGNVVYSSLHFIELVLLDSKSYRRMDRFKRIVSCWSNYEMIDRELGSSKGYDKEERSRQEDMRREDDDGRMKRRRMIRREDEGR